MTITIFTPTYNRADLLTGLYESLRKQTVKGFEWLVVDDGSTDGTVALMADIVSKEKGFRVRYIHKGNGGKHTAINVGAREAKGELFLMLDSDDELPPTAVEDVLVAWEMVRRKPDVGGVCGYMAHRSGEVIGRPFVDGLATTIDLRYKMGVTGDMCEVFRTRVMREFPFPEFSGERFCPEVLVWNRIAQKYKLSVFSKVIYWRDYLEGGLTDRIYEVRKKSPRATCMCYQEMYRLPIPFKYKLRAWLNYWRFRRFL